jgi:hypothetical protein
MSYQAHLAYFRPSGRFLAFATTTVDRESLVDIWARIVELRQLGELPGLRPKAGRDLLILVDVMGHPERKLHLIIPPFVNDDDVTPIQVPLFREDASAPMVRIPLDELPITRTSTRDVVRVELDDDDITPIDRPIPEPIDDK